MLFLGMIFELQKYKDAVIVYRIKPNFKTNFVTLFKNNIIVLLLSYDVR